MGCEAEVRRFRSPRVLYGLPCAQRRIYYPADSSDCPKVNVESVFPLVRSVWVFQHRHRPSGNIVRSYATTMWLGL